MVISYTRIALIGVLIAAIGQAPIPWVHCHAGMTQEQLLSHLRIYHPNCPTNRIPRGWHCHMIPLASPEIGAAAQDSKAPLVVSMPVGDRLGHLALARGPGGIDDLSESASALSAAALDEANSTLPRRSLFKLYQSLLI